MEGKYMKSKTTAIILSVLVGGLGIDRFYLGYIGMGILKLLTGGCFGVLYIIDIVNIATGKLKPADGSAYSEEIQTQNTSSVQVTTSIADELTKYKDLLDQGIISEEEFNLKKEQLLKLM